jgi:hypothetical protein
VVQNISEVQLSLSSGQKWSKLGKIAGYIEEVGSKKQVTGAGVASRIRDGEEKKGHGRGR